jgi:ribosomal protein L32
MTAAEKKFHLGARRLVIDEITTHPERFKVCQSCGMVSSTKARICGDCGAYRWDYDQSIVLATASRILFEK